MNLYVDVGNTAIKMAVDDGNAVKQIAFDAVHWASIKAVVVGQVGKASLLEPVFTHTAQYDIPIVEAKVSATHAGLTCAYPHYHNLGIDRWLAVIACYYLYPQQAVLVVDSGTATTVDALDAQGQHLGGWIIPGLDLMMDSLTKQTQKVFIDKTSPFVVEFGRNTPNAVKNGCLASTLGSIEIARSRLLNQTSCRVVFTGGYGKLLQSEMPGSDYRKELVFLGLKYWYTNQAG
jgi:type III pantothenate kinase